MNNTYTTVRPMFILAPMDDVTDTVFRQIILNCAAPDMMFTEFVNVDGLMSAGKQKVQTKLTHSTDESQLVAQLWGIDPDNFLKSAKAIVSGEFGQFIGIDLNMGCPVRDIIKNGACSALMNNRDLAEKIIEATKEGASGKLPISVKTRLGFNELDLSWHEFLLKQNLHMLTIHGRTKQQMSKGLSDWSQINEVRKLRDKISPNTLIVGNGDVKSRQQGNSLAKKYNLDGIMIARGIFNDPFVFSKDSRWLEYTVQQKLELFKKHVTLFNKTWAQTKPTKILNKFCKIYVNNFENAHVYREKLMTASSNDELLYMVDQLMVGHSVPS